VGLFAGGAALRPHHELDRGIAWFGPRRHEVDRHLGNFGSGSVRRDGGSPIRPALSARLRRRQVAVRSVPAIAEVVAVATVSGGNAGGSRYARVGLRGVGENSEDLNFISGVR
jgi:hypothetical protein